ncbi:MAG: phosphoribosylformylglycinamidine synthase subunit PurQ [Geovibrio sp.]|jgi:phosphoribosylformylglycinamidine synthase|uniref:phosphoribosylformylglycinamidine synthase subunit PurQ n=1 Tax=Geovibrio ferrireducens TaxID=46201 RepID=UPI002245229B|nr:phosphoribosylformylglycinamidine synthase subunit PurQ [Geovibrio ferrireducens]MCD8492830.1 phosphoribosylformylglycinamidine synthase subunit PurQ [Geovibrio sp.]
MKAGVVVFPGSNCDHDCYHILKHVLGMDTVFLWHKDADLKGADLVVLPGGFSYGDYLRCGAIAKHSPIMQEVSEFADKGGHVLGICNGFQVLTESGLLPGALLRNTELKFICKYVNLRVDNAGTAFTSRYADGEIVRIPIAHAEGNYFASEEVIKELEENNQVVFRYCDEYGETSEGSNPNGSINGIAGIINKGGNVLGMMPHPERCAEEIMQTKDGFHIFESLRKVVKGVL